MTNIFLKANGSSLEAKTDGKITSGMIGLSVSLEYNDSWVGLTKDVFFKVGNQVRKQESVGTKTTVPWELLRHGGGVLEIGVRGKDASGSIVLPTVWATVAKIQDGANGEILSAPNPNSGGISPSGSAIDDSVVSKHSTWSSKNTVDKLCPPINESGVVVTCEPVEGYPLEVTAQEGATTITQCGKNLIGLPYDSGKNFSYGGLTFTANADGSVTINGTSTAMVGFSFLEPNTAKPWLKPGVSYCITPAVGSVTMLVSYRDDTNTTVYWYSSRGPLVWKSTYSAMRIYIQIQSEKTLENVTFYPQVEVGSVPTAFEPYWSETYEPGATIPARVGINNIWADSGNVTVTGRADPVAIINKLSNAILSLGSNV